MCDANINKIIIIQLCGPKLVHSAMCLCDLHFVVPLLLRSRTRGAYVCAPDELAKEAQRERDTRVSEKLQRNCHPNKRRDREGASEKKECFASVFFSLHFRLYTRKLHVCDAIVRTGVTKATWWVSDRVAYTPNSLL